METATALNKRAGRRPGIKETRPRRTKIPRGHRIVFKEVVTSVLEEISESCSRELVRLALHAKFEPTRLGAIREIYDRMLGKSPQPVTGTNGEGPVQVTFSWRRPDEPAEIKVVEHE
jgi:hypothetical protein